MSADKRAGNTYTDKRQSRQAFSEDDKARLEKAVYDFEELRRKLGPGRSPSFT